MAQQRMRAGPRPERVAGCHDAAPLWQIRPRGTSGLASAAWRRIWFKEGLNKSILDFSDKGSRKAWSSTAFIFNDLTVVENVGPSLARRKL
jgi:hypothetical protein